MKHSRLRRLLFLALCCDFGLFGKQLIAPVSNIITDAMRIPGGISTGFSLMFTVIAAAMVPRFGCAALLSTVQSLVMIAMGRVGSMGLLSPIGYIVPGLAIDAILWMTKKMPLTRRLVLANSVAAIFASLTANIIVFRLSGAPLLLYLCITALSGVLFGLLGAKVVPLVSRAVSFGIPKED